MDKKEIERLIEAYVARNISNEDKTKLMALTKENSNLLNDIESRMDIVQSLKYIGNQELKTKLANIHNLEYKNLDGPKKASTSQWLYIAIALTGFIAAGFLLYKNYFKSASSEQLYASYFEPYKASFYNRSNDESNFSDLKTAYDKQEYREVINLANSMADIEIYEGELLLAVGVSALQTDELELSRIYFERIIQTEDFFFIDHARWYLALGFLKEGNRRSAKFLLNKLSANPKANHYKEATNLLEQIK